MCISLLILCKIVYNIKGEKNAPTKEKNKELEKNGFIFKRHGASHDLYFKPNTKQTIPVKRHDFNENDMRYILKEANIEGGK